MALKQAINEWRTRPELLASNIRDKTSVRQDGRLEEPQRHLRDIGFLLPGTSQELRRKRSGLFAQSEGTTVFAAGTADYAHSLLNVWYANREAELADILDPQFALHYSRLLTRRAVVTTSWQQCESLFGSTRKRAASLRVFGGYLDGIQRYEADVLYADELLVFAQTDEDEAGWTALLVHADDERLGWNVLVDGSVDIRFHAIAASGKYVSVSARAAELLAPRWRSLADYQWAARQLAWLERASGAAFALAVDSGPEPEVQVTLGQLLQHIDALSALLDAAEAGGSIRGELYLPHVPSVLTARLEGSLSIRYVLGVLRDLTGTGWLREENADLASIDEILFLWLGSGEGLRMQLRERHAFGGGAALARELYGHCPFADFKAEYDLFWQEFDGFNGGGEQ